MRKVTVVALLFGMITTVLLAGCASSRLMTPSGKPEVTVSGVTKKQAIDALTSQMVAQGFHVAHVDDYKAEYEKEGGFWQSVFFGSHFNSTSVSRISFDVFDSEGGVRIMGRAGIVTNPGSGFEQVTDATSGKTAQNLQSILESIGGVASSGPSRPSSTDGGKIGVRFDNQIVTGVTPGSSAEAVGIQVGDKILEVNGQPMNGDGSHDMGLLAGPAGTQVALLLQRGANKVNVTAERK